MTTSISRQIQKAVRNIPNLLQGYNIYVNRDKLRLIDIVFTKYFPEATSFVDLGGVWKVNAAYSLHTLKIPSIQRGTLVDTDYPAKLEATLIGQKKLKIVRGDFSQQQLIDNIGKVDVVFLFDVLLHQANPDWDEVLNRYSEYCSCFVIYNQQFIRSEETVRLLDLPLEEYISLIPEYQKEYCRYVFSHKDEIHPKYKKPLKDIHNIFQWGITDNGLRSTMNRLGYREAYFKNYGMFVDLPAFENHAFIFMKK
jgi:hypothetical protein